MKLSFIISFFIVHGMSHPAYSELISLPNTSGDTISRMEKRVEMNLNLLYSMLEIEYKSLDSLQHEMTLTGIDNKQLKKIKHTIESIQNNAQLHLKKQNAYRLLLGMIHQLKFKKTEQALNQLKEIDKSLSVLDKNKIPTISHIKEIPATPYLRVSTNVYDQEIAAWCNLTKNADGKTIANEFEHFFDYTDPKIASHFKENDFLQCQTRFIKTTDAYFLEFKFTLNSPKASSLYGNIDPSIPVKIDFIDGDFSYLEVYALTSGILDPETGSTVYNVQFKLDREDMRRLSKKDVDKVTIIWTSGADQFEISKLDLLRNLFECIQKRKLQN